MPNFTKYMSLKKHGTTEVLDIEFGQCYVFPKLDGTNASVWVDLEGNLKAGSRNRELSVKKDNAGFYGWVLENESWFKGFFEKHPEVTLFGEWLVPHSLKTYREDAWRRFYIFDVYSHKSETYLSYDVYQEWLETEGFDYLAPMYKVRNISDEIITSLLTKNNYLIKEGEGSGEGIVIKNYSFVNRFGKTVFAKVVTSEFKDKHVKEMGAPEIGQQTIEEKIVEKYVDEHLINKTYSKIVNEAGGWDSKLIGKLLGLVWYDLIDEDLWEALKTYKNPTINFRRLQSHTITKIKEVRKDLF